MTPAARLAGRTLRTISPAVPRLAGRLAFALFAYPGPRARIRPTEQDVHDRAQAELVPLAGHRVAVYRWGDGTRPVLLLHGWGLRGSRFAPLVTALLDRGFSPVTVDAPGHGASSGRNTHLLEYTEIVHSLQQRHGPFEGVVGHSFGGLTGYHAVRVRATTATRLVTIGSPCEIGYLPDTFTRQLGLGPRLGAELRRRIERFFPAENDLWTRLSATYRAAELPVEVLVVHDRDDPVVDPAQAERIATAYAPRSRLFATGGLGHHRVLAAPEVIGQVVDFLTAAPANTRA